MTLGAGGLGDAVVGIDCLEGEGFLVQRGDGTGFEAADELVLDGLDGHHQMAQQERIGQLLLTMKRFDEAWTQSRELRGIHGGQHVSHLVRTDDRLPPGAAEHAPVVPKHRVVAHFVDDFTNTLTQKKQRSPQ